MDKGGYKPSDHVHQHSAYNVTPQRVGMQGGVRGGGVCRLGVQGGGAGWGCRVRYQGYHIKLQCLGA